MTLYEFVSLTFPTPEIRSRGCFQLEVNFNNNKLAGDFGKTPVIFKGQLL